jgi:exodeoxyribonuclease VII small subunit
MAKKTTSIEEQIERLDEISDLLERGDIPIEEQLKLYTEGVTLARTAREYLEKAELKVRQLNDEHNENSKDAE